MTRWSIALASSGALLAISCCKQPSEDPPPVKAEPASARASATALTPAAETAAPAETVDAKPKDPNQYQSNGFPQVMPKEKTAVPTASEWNRAPGITTKKFPDGCHMKFVREWLQINCSKDDHTASPMALNNLTGFGSEGADFFKFVQSGKVISLVVRTKDGKKGTATLVTDRGSYLVGYDWPYKAPFPSTIWQ